MYLSIDFCLGLYSTMHRKANKVDKMVYTRLIKLFAGSFLSDNHPTAANYFHPLQKVPFFTI